MPTHLRFRRRSFLGLMFLFSLSTTALYFIYSAPGIVNEYLFMVQATGIHIKDNVKNIGAQVLEQVVRGGYNINGTDYAYDFNLSESDVPPTTYLPNSFTYLPSQICPERLPSMKGRLEVNMSEIALEDVEKVLLNAEPSMTLGGYWKPRDCVPRWKVAILVPFRNRHEHLPILLRHLVPALQKQRLQFAFYVVEQVGSEPFNRAMLFNVGFREAMRDLDWDCMVFHDVDHMLENDRNYYGCGDMPRHFAVKLNKYSYMLPYNEFFGGVSGLTVEQFTKINGFPNAFWGWGGEDDDLWNRVQYANYTVSRPQGELGRYMSIPHHHRGEVQFLGRYTLLRRSKERQSLDGLNNLQYSPLVSRRPLYTNISVSLSRKLAPVADYN
ncbi:beta-1,4-galactosyltransferase 5-like isoform X1 [Coregonus clupeaformis]|uniref:beta-1,4-galactosyltransferase 5-like isoform X1 n=2 Tax=Coregonus clupeaformis TaxID=59861 RepID=UPI001BE089D0|nr:beta-1,4-galactosyltransferase 5-like isoform X1 [Coregonus clupeaformis]